MRLNADFSLRVAVHGDTVPWQPSPIAGVERRMLDRIGDEVARATSIVRYAPASQFSPHVHGGGEEFLVLDGVFQDEQGDYPAGSYVRNPPDSRHTPGSKAGCILLVKLWQFDPADRVAVRIQSEGRPWVDDPVRAGVQVRALHGDGRETVSMQRWLGASEVHIDSPGGIELLVLSGSFSEQQETFRRYSWLRLPPGRPLRAATGSAGCQVWLKSGHLQHLV